MILKKENLFIIEEAHTEEEKVMLKSKLQERLLEEYQSGFSDGRKMMEQDVVQAAKDGTPIDIDGRSFIIINRHHVLHSLRKRLLWKIKR